MTTFGQNSWSYGLAPCIAYQTVACMCGKTAVVWCSQPFGFEAPELAQSFLAVRTYVPSSQQDMWCLGQAMLEGLDASKPHAQAQILCSGPCQQEQQAHRRSREHLKYLAALKSTSYADAVCVLIYTCVLATHCCSHEAVSHDRNC